MGFTGISVVCFGWRITLLNKSTNVVGGICGLQTDNNSNGSLKGERQVWDSDIRGQWWALDGERQWCVSDEE